MPSPPLIARDETADVEEQATLLRGWNQQYQQISPGPFRGELEQIHLDGVRLFRESTTQRVHQAGAHRAGELTMVLPLRLSEPQRWRGMSVGVGDIAFLWGEQEIDMCTPQQCELFAVTVDRDAFAAYADRVAEFDVDRLTSSALLEAPLPARRAMEGLLHTTLRAVVADPAALEHPRAQQALRDSIYAALVDTLDQHPLKPTPRAGAQARKLVSKARAYLCEHRNEAIGVHDMCRLLGVSERMLQYAFQQVLGIAPRSFFRALRLNSVRRDLKRPGTGTAVLDVAARWGFWHPSHFSADYKRMFSELPSQTLRRAS
jgi:AraC family ethanolamine operon transcriptional activator